MQNKTRHILAFIHLLIIGVWLCGSSLFVHRHVIDGVAISHSHPYANDATAHTHSASDIVSIARVANANMLCGEELTRVDAAPCVVHCSYADVSYDTFVITLPYYSLRAPPAVA